MMTDHRRTSASASHRDISLTTSDGRTLRGRWWRRPTTRGIIVVAHGFGEHGGTYAATAEAIGQALDVEVVAFDLRGHGRSSGRRGIVRRYEDLVSDLAHAIEWTARARPEVPRFVLGHSNGGQVALRLALDPPLPIDGFIVSNPALRILMAIPPHVLRVGMFLNRYAPWITLRAATKVERLTRDVAVQRHHLADRLRHNRMSAPLFFGMVQGGAMLIDRAHEIRSPIVMVIGGQDPIVDPSAAREFYDRLGSDDKTLLLYPKMLHEPLNELGREQVLADLIRWLEPRLRA